VTVLLDVSATESSLLKKVGAWGRLNVLGLDCGLPSLALMLLLSVDVVPLMPLACPKRAFATGENEVFSSGQFSYVSKIRIRWKPESSSARPWVPGSGIMACTSARRCEKIACWL